MNAAARLFLVLYLTGCMAGWIIVVVTLGLAWYDQVPPPTLTVVAVMLLAFCRFMENFSALLLSVSRRR